MAATIFTATRADHGASQEGPTARPRRDAGFMARRNEIVAASETPPASAARPRLHLRFGADG